jgi:hypothetical protein
MGWQDVREKLQAADKLWHVGADASSARPWRAKARVRTMRPDYINQFLGGISSDRLIAGVGKT